MTFSTSKLGKLQVNAVPDIRVSVINEAEVNPQGKYVLYWMVAQRRTTWNFGLQRALEWSQRLEKPLLIFEPLRIGYQWASDRFHHFVIKGMKDNLTSCNDSKVSYYPYVEPELGAGKGLLAALSASACIIVTDEYPCYFIPRMVQTAAKHATVMMEQVDSNGLLPLRASGRVFTTAASFRRHLQKTLLPFFASEHFPMRDPLETVKSTAAAVIDPLILERWPQADIDHLLEGGLSDLDIDHKVEVIELEHAQGGSKVASRLLDYFIEARLWRYHSDRNALESGAASGLSAHIHFGHISVHEIAQRVFECCEWNPGKVAAKPSGSREGWWGASQGVEAFIDELVTWRELGYAFCFHRLEDYDQLSSLPEWALKTIAKHRDDPKPYIYDLETFEKAETHDPLWNAAQRQLIREGRIHNYVRMLWGKKIYEWSAQPEDALHIMIELNNKYALDGRDPNSYSGIFWCLGRFDRAWGPERSIFGKLRYMSSDSTMRKLKAKNYVKRYQNLSTQGELF